jgi:glycosyltransferase involved in cell wall biosynthesis
MHPHWKPLQWIPFMLILVAGIEPLFAGKSSHKNDVEFLIVIPSFNNNRVDAAGKNCIEENLESVFSQTHDWTLCYINDCSTDGTGEVAQRYAAQRGMMDKCRFINNSVNRGALANLYNVISKCPGHKVIVLLDGDDKLADTKVLDVVAREYRIHDTWMTYGSYIKSPPGTRGRGAHIPSKVMRHQLFRKWHFVTSHLRTFFAGLFQHIPIEALRRNGRFWRGGWDLIILFPMLEMASEGHIRYIKRILYKWNSVNPLSDYRIHSDEQRKAKEWVRAQPPFAPLKELFPTGSTSKKHHHKNHHRKKAIDRMPISINASIGE